MSDFENVIERAAAAVAKGIADVTVDEVPDTFSTREIGSKRGDPIVASEGTHRVRLVVEWTEMQT